MFSQSSVIQFYLYKARHNTFVIIYLVIHIYVFYIYIYKVLDTSLHVCLNNFPWIQFDCKFRAFPFAFVAFRPPLPIGHGLRSLLCGILAEAAKVGDG